MASESRLRLAALRAGYGGRLLVDGFSRDFGPGIHAVVGPNGAGKSTLLKTVCGIVPLLGGTVTVAGADLVRQPMAARRALSYAPAEAEAYPFMTGHDLLRLACAAKGLDASVEAPPLCERFAFAGDIGKRFDRMSTGMRRKAFLVAALVGAPRVLLLDEPSDALDASAREGLIAELSARRESSAILIATHDLELVDRLGAERIAWPPG
jgi:ABC-type multidrug transport system ATPase subunit